MPRIPKRLSDECVVEQYRVIKMVLIKLGYSKEIEWQDSLDFDIVSETIFLRESAWVVLSSGMRETVVRRLFPAFSTCFFDWRSATRIAENSSTCARKALSVFGHTGKVNAIIRIAERLEFEGFESLKNKIVDNSIQTLQSLPFVGPVTSFHLAKNLGLEVAKPDRHLVRIAAATGFSSTQSLCEKIAEKTGDKISVVDLVLWRFATINPEYTDFFAEPSLRSTLAAA